MMKLCGVSSGQFRAFVAKKGIPLLLSGVCVCVWLLLFCLPAEDALKITAVLSLLSRSFRGPTSDRSWNEWLKRRPGGGSITWKELTTAQEMEA